MQITSLDYSSFLGRIAIGKVARGTIKEGQPIALMQADGIIKKVKGERIIIFEGMGKKSVTEVRQEIFVQLLVWKILILVIPLPMLKIRKHYL